MKCGAWKTGRSYAERSCAHGAQLLCLVSRGRSPGTITDRCATLRRERLTEEPPKGETGHLPGDTRQQSESFTRSSKSSLLEIAFRISLYRTSIWCVVCRSVHHFDVCNYAYVHHFDVYPLTTHTDIHHFDVHHHLWISAKLTPFRVSLLLCPLHTTPCNNPQ